MAEQNIYRRTVKGKVFKMYAQQVLRSKKRNYKLPTYTKEQLLEWLKNQPSFEGIWENWVKSNYLQDLAPSVDRIDDYKSYTISNIRLTTWAENRNKYYLDSKIGVNTKSSFAVMQFDLNGVFIKSFYSIRKASRETGILNGAIGNCCRGSSKTSGGYIWKFKN